MNISTIIRRPITTEKTILQPTAFMRYTFEVDRTASKTQIKKALEEQFGVRVTDITTSVRKGKTRRSPRRRNVVAIAPMKKATVTLAKDQRIDILEVKE